MTTTTRPLSAFPEASQTAGSSATATSAMEARWFAMAFVYALAVAVEICSSVDMVSGVVGEEDKLARERSSSRQLQILELFCI